MIAAAIMVFMIKRLIVGYDGSKASQAAALYAFDLAKKTDLPVVGVFVIDERLLKVAFLEDLASLLGLMPYADLTDRVREALEKKADALLSDFAALARSAGVRASLVQLRGVPHRELANFADEEDLLFVGARGLKEEDYPFAGPTAERVVRRARCPVFVSPEEHRPITRVGAAFDGSPVSKRALELAAWIAKVLNASLEVIFVEPKGDYPGELVDNLKNEAEALLQREGIEFTFTLLRGLPEEKLVEYQEHGNVDLLVMGAFGTRPLKELLLGSVAYYVLHHAKGPVIFAK